MMCARNRKNRDVQDVQDVVKITGQIEVVSACPDASYAVESTLQEQAGVKQNSDRLQRSHQHTGNLPEDSSRTKRASQDGIHQPRGRPPRRSHGQNESPANQTPRDEELARLREEGGFAKFYEFTDKATNVVYIGKVISKARLIEPRQTQKVTVREH
ncbi:hypothetical protein MTO96_015912 [Rhipicephalus appendiculatus]